MDETPETERPGGAGDLRPEWLLERAGTRYVRYAGLLALAHARGLKRLTTALVQAPAAANGHVAIAAVSVMEGGRCVHRRWLSLT